MICCLSSIPELNDDVLLLILSCLNLKDRIRVERGTFVYTCTVLEDTTTPQSYITMAECAVPC